MSTPKIIRPEDAAYVKALIYAPAGHGKTTFLGTALDDPRTNPMLLLDFEGGVKSLAGRPMDVAPIKSWEDFNEVYDYLVNGEGATKYKSLGLDSVSEIQIFGLLNILDSDDRRDQDLVLTQDWGKILVQLRRLLRSFRDLPMHVLFTALCKEDTDVRQGLVKKPALSGQMAEEILGIMDVVSYLALGEDDETGEMTRALLLRNFSKIRVKVRTAWGRGEEVPELIEDPTITKLFDALEGREFSQQDAEAEVVEEEVQEAPPEEPKPKKKGK